MGLLFFELLANQKASKPNGTERSVREPNEQPQSDSTTGNNEKKYEHVSKNVLKHVQIRTKKARQNEYYNYNI